AAVEPGASFECRFVVPDAGTFWYRPSVAANGQRMRGPFGALLVAETEPVEVDRDTLVLVEKLPDAQLAGRLTLQPHQRLRLRIVNALRTLLPLRLDRHRTMVMAIDGQPAEPFAVRDGRMTLAPGNRTDLFVDMTAEANATATLVAETERGELPLLHLISEGQAARSAPLPDARPLPA